MTREEALTAIRSVEPALRRLGLASAALFGSLARGAGDEASDVDIAVRPAPDVSIGPERMLDLYGVFSELFGYRQPIDVVVLPARDRALNDAIERDAVIAFS